MPYQLSPRIILNEGDRIKVSGGPYYITKLGVKVHMGEKGIGEFVRYEETSQAIFVRFNRDSSLKYVYMGPEKISENTGVTLIAHTIVKIKTRKKS